jgi:uncharacterized membrane protein
VRDVDAGEMINHRSPEDNLKAPPQPESHAVGILVAALAILLAFALWLAALTQRSIWTDELSTLAMFPAPDIRSLVQQVAESERRPPLYFILVWSWSKIAGTNEFALRYFSLGFTTLALAIWFALARSVRRLFGIRQRAFVWFALALGVLAPDIALYGVMLRYYSFLLCLSLGLNLIFVRWLAYHGNVDPAAEDDDRHQNGTILVACWLGVAVMLAYTDYSVAALIFAQMLWLGAYARSLGRKLRPWGIALATLFIAYIPLFAALRTQVGRDGLHADLSQSPAGVALNLLYPIFSYTFGETILPWHLLVLAAMPFVGLAFAGLLRNLRTQPMLRFSLLLVAIPFIFNALLETTVATDLTFLTMASRTWFVLPLFVMLVALGVVALPTRIRLLSTTLLLAADLAALSNLLAGEQFHNPIFAVPLREVAATIRSEGLPGDVLLADVDIGFEYYWQIQPTAGTQFIRSEDWPAPQGAVEAAQPRRVWLITFGRDRTRLGDHADEIRAWLAQRYEQRAERKYVPIDPGYRAVKQWLLRRETYDAKLVVQRYERVR